MAKKKSAAKPESADKPAETPNKGAHVEEGAVVDGVDTVQTAEQRGDTPIEGVDPFPPGYVPDEGLHGNADY